MRITDEIFSAWMVLWADWCCQAIFCDARGYPKSANFIHDKSQSDFGPTILIEDSTSLEEIERYVRDLAVNSAGVADAVRAHWEARPDWQNLKVHKKCGYLGVSERRYRERVKEGHIALKAVMQSNNFNPRL